MDTLKPAPSHENSDFLDIQSAESLDYRLEIAGMGARAHAFIIDWHIRILLAITWFALVNLIFFKLNLNEIFKEPNASIASFATLVLLLPPTIIYFLYHPVIEMIMAGRTPGKRMTGVRLVDLQGHSPSVGALLLRNVFRLIDGLPGIYCIGLISVAVTRHHVRIGDLAAGLVLVYDNSVASKTMQQMSSLALNSPLSLDDQSLLLDMLARWRDLSREKRIDYAERFLTRIGQPLPAPAKPANYEKALKHQLDSLLTPS
ncbi:RDD family protein [Methylomonas sp. AM2-LC]|uniref:RDD family protein n=1 Tax=Methylomonas sp. AM2-LC TaxID=3153301 RepID=UPI0032634D02